MPKSVRVSDHLYQKAEASSRSQHRSLTQQIEHWAELGVAIEAAGITAAQVRAILSGDLRARERKMLGLGLADPESMYLIPSSLVRKTKVRFPELEE